jgi:hypothetical protein
MPERADSFSSQSLLVGRESELAELRQGLAHARRRWVALRP